MQRALAPRLPVQDPDPLILLRKERELHDANTTIRLRRCGGDRRPRPRRLWRRRRRRRRSGGDTTAAPTEEAPEFEAGTTMAELSEAGAITIGTKFDQPLFGLRRTGRRSPTASTSRSARSSPPSSASTRTTSSGSRPSPPTGSPSSRTGQVDIVVATYTINDERKQVVDFAGPYYVAGQTIMVLESNTDINGPDDLAGKKVCSAEGSTPAERIRTDYPDAELMLADAYSECLEPLRNGQVDAVTTDNVILSGFVDQNPGEFKLVEASRSPRSPTASASRGATTTSAPSSTTSSRSPSRTAAGPRPGKRQPVRCSRLPSRRQSTGTKRPVVDAPGRGWA